jgi:hypothetical protein
MGCRKRLVTYCHGSQCGYVRSAARAYLRLCCAPSTVVSRQLVGLSKTRGRWKHFERLPSHSQVKSFLAIGPICVTKDDAHADAPVGLWDGPRRGSVSPKHEPCLQIRGHGNAECASLGLHCLCSGQPSARALYEVIDGLLILIPSQPR